MNSCNPDDAYPVGLLLKLVCKADITMKSRVAIAGVMQIVSFRTPPYATVSAYL